MGPKRAPNKWGPFIWAHLAPILLFGAYLEPIWGPVGSIGPMFSMCRYGYVGLFRFLRPQEEARDFRVLLLHPYVVAADLSRHEGL